MQCNTCSNDAAHLYSDLYHCPKCDLISSSNMGHEDIYDKKYIELYQIHSRIGQDILQIRRELVSSYLRPGSSLLDFGCGTGEFVESMESEYDAYGYDINPASGYSDAKVLQGSHDALTFWDSIEHSNDPRGVLESLPSRFVFISVPCVDDFNGDDITTWKHYKPHEHVYYYTEKALINFVESCGYKVLEVNFDEAKFRKGINGKNIITIVGVNN